jgi:four helix bundle protein
MDINTAKEKSRLFSIKIAQLYKHLSNNKKETILSEQLLRSGTSIGARLAEAECALSRNDVLVKLHGALEKSAESRYWLEILNSADLLTEYEFKTHVQDCDELRHILFTIVKNLKAALSAPGPAKKA